MSQGLGIFSSLAGVAEPFRHLVGGTNGKKATHTSGSVVYCFFPLLPPTVPSQGRWQWFGFPCSLSASLIYCSSAADTQKFRNLRS